MDSTFESKSNLFAADKTVPHAYLGKTTTH